MTIDVQTLEDQIREAAELCDRLVEDIANIKVRRELAMRTDPRKACANEKQLLGWAIAHDLIAHPFMVLTGYSSLSLRFHDKTSRLAWPRAAVSYRNGTFSVPTDRFGNLTVRRLAQRGFYEIQHPVIAHRFVVKADGVQDAADQAEEWFGSLVELIPESEVSHGK